MRQLKNSVIMVVLLAVILTAAVVPAVGAPTINGAGATFPEPIYAHWMTKYYELNLSLIHI